MPALDIPKGPASPAGSPAVLGPGREGARERAPPEAHRGSGAAGGVGVYRGEGSLSRPLRSSPSLRDRSLLRGLRLADTLEGSPKSRARALRTTRPLSPGAWGFSGRPAGGCSLLGPFRASGQRKVSLLPSTLRGASSLQKTSASLSPCLFFSLPQRRQELGTAEPRLHLSRRGDPNSLLRASFSQDSKPAAAAARAAALLSRLPGPPRAPGELGQRPRDAGAAGLRAPAPQLAGPTAPGGRGGGGGRCALLETRC